jgi:hypothetical protein
MFKKIISFIAISMPIRVLARVVSIFFIWYRLRAIISGKYLIFVLDHERFREDIGILRESTDVYYMSFPYWLQDKIIGILDISSIKEKKIWLSEFVMCLCNAINSIGFISAGMHYKRHAIWEDASISAKKSFYCLHREGIGSDRDMIIRIFKSVSKKRKFQGSILMVGTKTLKDVLVEQDYFPKDRIIVTGMPRFDKIYTYMNSKSSYSGEESTVLFFSFFVCFFSDTSSGLYPVDGGFRELFNQVHSTAAQFALEHPESNVVIKMKWYEGSAKENVDNAITNGTGISPDKITNLKIIDDVPAQELIKKSRVVIGFNSTTVIESLLYGKMVIVPSFAEASKKENINDVFYSNQLKYFYRANSKNNLMDLIKKCYSGKNDFLVPDKSFINETIGPYDGKVCSRIEDVIISG